MKKIAVDLFEFIYDRLVKYIRSNDITYIKDLWEHLLDLRDIDNAIHTYAEQEFEKKYNYYKLMPETHGLKRMAVLLLNIFGEGVFDGTTIITSADRYENSKNKHLNKYIIKLHDSDAHKFIYGKTPNKTDQVYDFDLTLMGQLTTYADGAEEDTTAHMYDTLTGKKYSQDIVHQADFKSDLWKSKKHMHNVQFIIKLDALGNPEVYITKANGDSYELLADYAAVISNLTQQNKDNLLKYKELLSEINSGIFDNLTWDDLITKIDNSRKDFK